MTATTAPRQLRAQAAPQPLGVNLTPSQAKARLSELGITQAEFARIHGLPPDAVYQVLSGRKRGRNGNTHTAAVLLGLKQGIAFPQVIG